MSKLTRSVIYLSESDRPKKVEPLSFFDYSKNFLEPSQTTIEFVEWDIKLLNEYATKYSTYLQEFSAEEVGVVFTAGFVLGDQLNENCRQPAETEIYYLGKCVTHGDLFMDRDSGGRAVFFKGHLNSGKY